MARQSTVPQTDLHHAERSSANTDPAPRDSPKRIWIDLDNSPHVPFFAPIIAELERRGHSVVLTARDCFQVFALADLHGFRYQRVGHHYGKHKLMKAFGTCRRALQLLPSIRNQRPDLALSHGSRSQLIAARLAGIPAVVICDYEFAEPVPGAAPACVIVPEVIPDDAVLFGRRRILKYPGTKEDVYVSGFRPDPTLLAELGLDPEDLIVTLRPPATEAHYRNPESDALLEATLHRLSQTPRLRIVLLPRNEKQGLVLRKSWPELFRTGKMIIPGRALDGLNLIWHSDLVVSGGGTMNREAAALGVPVYSIFRGNIGAVDRYLAARGRLVLLETVDDVQHKLSLARRTRLSRPQLAASSALDAILRHLMDLLEQNDRAHRRETSPQYASVSK